MRFPSTRAKLGANSKPDFDYTNFGLLKFYRDDNLVSGDVLFKGFDFHLLKDSWGSYQEYAKV